MKLIWRNSRTSFDISTFYLSTSNHPQKENCAIIIRSFRKKVIKILFTHYYSSYPLLSTSIKNISQKSYFLLLLFFQKTKLLSVFVTYSFVKFYFKFQRNFFFTFPFFCSPFLEPFCCWCRIYSLIKIIESHHVASYYLY